MAILRKLKDWWGQSAEISTTDVQTDSATIAAIRQEFATHPARGLTPGRLAQILDAAESGDLTAQVSLAEDMEERDAHLYAELSKRISFIAEFPWTIVPSPKAGGSDDRLVGELREWVESLGNVEGLIRDCCTAILRSFAAIEIQWGITGALRLPQSLTLRPHHWFMQDILHSGDSLLLRNSSGKGESLWPLGWIIHRHQSRTGYLGRAGLLRVLAWPYLFKNYSIRDLADYLEIHGLPLRLGKYPAGATPVDKQTLLNAVTMMGHNAAGIIPEGMAVEFVEAAKAPVDPFMAMIEWAERSESKAILGQTLSGEAKATGLGSGLAEFHSEVLERIIRSDAKQLAATLTSQLLFPLLVLNRGWTDPLICPRWHFDFSETEDLTTFSEAIPKLVAVGMPIPVSWAREKLGIPAPEEGEPLLQATSAPADQPVKSEDGEDEPPSANSTTRVALQTSPDSLDELTQEATKEWKSQLTPIIDPLVQAAEKSADYDEFLQRLETIPLAADELIHRLTIATFKARGMGDATDKP